MVITGMMMMMMMIIIIIIVNRCFSKAPSWLYKLQWLTYRSFLQVLRDPSVQLIRILQKIVGIVEQTAECDLLWDITVRIVEQTAEYCFVMGYSST